MLGISRNCTILFKTDGPRMLAAAAPRHFFPHSHSRNCTHAGKAREFGSSFGGVASLVDYCAADSLLSATPPEPRTILERPRPISVNKNSGLHVRLLNAIAAMEFTSLDLGKTL